MSLTLIEAAKLRTGEVQRAAIIELYAMSADILRVLPFTDIPGNAMKYNREDALPGVAFRGVNESYTESTGVINPQMEPLVIAGGDVDVDKFIVDTQGADQRAVQETMKVKALAHKIGNSFIKGDSSTEPREFDGLQVRLTGNQLIDAGATSGGDALSLAKLDELIDAVDDPTHLILSKAMRRRLTVAARTEAVAGNITFGVDEFGRQIMKYNDLPLLLADRSDNVYGTLAFNEANPGGGSNVGTSIYCISAMEGHLMGIQNGTISVRDLGELETKPSFRTRVEWYPGIALYHPRAAARLRGIKDVAVVA